MTLVEYADLQCPFCAEWARNALPTLAWDYVRAGKLKIEFRGLAFVGEDSDKALRFALAAGDENKLWHAVELLYWNQGTENTGWVTDAKLDAVATAIGLDGAALRARGDKTPVVHAIAESTTAARDDGVSSTPTILVWTERRHARARAAARARARGRRSGDRVRARPQVSGRQSGDPLERRLRRGRRPVVARAVARLGDDIAERLAA